MKLLLIHKFGYISNIDIIRIGLILLVVISGNYKWFSPEMMYVYELTVNSWLSFLPDLLGKTGVSYFLAVFQALTGVVLLAGFVFPLAGVTGTFLVILSSATMLSIIGYGYNSESLSLVIKEVMILSSGLITLINDLAILKIDNQHSAHVGR